MKPNYSRRKMLFSKYCCRVVRALKIRSSKTRTLKHHPMTKFGWEASQENLDSEFQDIVTGKLQSNRHHDQILYINWRKVTEKLRFAASSDPESLCNSKRVTEKLRIAASSDPNPYVFRKGSLRSFAKKVWEVSHRTHQVLCIHKRYEDGKRSIAG